MNDAAISVRGLGKRYRLRESAGPRGSYRTLRDELMGLPGRLLGGLRAPPANDFWALRDVSFDVRRGEVLGVIGRNGAGKSTLLKVLSRIIEPSEGEVDLYGRVGSLLEVGTGFHPELTGRENVFLSGAIQGMRRHEVRARLDDIVAFAGVERFLDEPVKHYSSGMYSRLAFAVAAHLESEVLLMDEVLAVGDAEFQRRCLGKMKEVASGGRTVLFVSHNLSAIRQLCPRCLWLEAGRMRNCGDTGVVMEEYLRKGSVAEGTRFRERPEGAAVWISEAAVQDTAGRPAGEFFIGDAVTLTFRLHATGDALGRRTKLAVSLRTDDGIALANMVDVDSDFAPAGLLADQRVSVRLEDIRLYPGFYHASIWVGGVESMDEYATWEDAFGFSILEGGGRLARPLPRSAGLFFLTPRWALDAGGEGERTRL